MFFQELFVPLKSINQTVTIMEERENPGRFVIRPYSKSELGMLYVPTLCPKHGWQVVRRWIRRCKPLSEALAATGLKEHNRMLSPRQVRLIAEHLGEP